MWKIIQWQRNTVLIETLLILLIFTVLIWYLQYLWNRRKLYKASINLPGPFALPIIGSALYFVGKPFDTFDTIMLMFNRYPKLFAVWFGQRLFYCVSDPKYFEIILAHPHALRKENLYRMAEPVVGQGLFTAKSVTQWKKHRKLINPTFNQKILDSFMDVFVQQSEMLVNIIGNFAGRGEADVAKLISRCTLDIICETAMGVQIKAQSTNSSFPHMVDRVMEIIMIRIFNIFYHSDLIFNNSPLGKDFSYCTEQLRSFCRKVLEEKRMRKNVKAQYKKRKAFLDLLLEINEESDYTFTDEELMDETITFMIAGSDTTATTNCFMLTMMGLHQNIQEKVLTEILEVVGPDSSVQLSHLSQLKYLEKAIKETLRLFPLGSFLVRTADENINLGDAVIHKGCSIVFGILRAQRSSQYWPDPLKFDPDRFSPEESVKRSPGYFIPFSHGPRNCIGMKYGMMAMKTLLATVIRKYHISTTYESVEDIKLKTNLVLRPEDGYKVYFDLRK